MSNWKNRRLNHYKRSASCRSARKELALREAHQVCSAVLPSVFNALRPSQGSFALIAQLQQPRQTIRFQAK
eukprot:scaffold654_cov274-Pinguiococcus_pyrenoidosus.AAC.5